MNKALGLFCAVICFLWCSDALATSYLTASVWREGTNTLIFVNDTPSSFTELSNGVVRVGKIDSNQIVCVRAGIGVAFEEVIRILRLFTDNGFSHILLEQSEIKGDRVLSTRFFIRAHKLDSSEDAYAMDFQERMKSLPCDPGISKKIGEPAAGAYGREDAAKPQR